MRMSARSVKVPPTSTPSEYPSITANFLTSKASSLSERRIAINFTVAQENTVFALSSFGAYFAGQYISNHARGPALKRITVACAGRSFDPHDSTAFRFNFGKGARQLGLVFTAGMKYESTGLTLCAS